MKINPEHIEEFLNASIQMIKVLNSTLQFVSNLFDQYAGNYDKHLFLEYQGDKVLVEQLENHFLLAENTLFDNCLDIGCATGKVGVMLQEYIKNIDGLDVSKEMLDIACSTTAYKNLYCQNILNADMHINKQYNLITAADVLPYWKFRKLMVNIDKLTRFQPFLHLPLSTIRC